MFEKTSLKSRLLLIATVPITVMLVLGLSGAWKKYADYQSHVQAESLVSLVIELGEAVHELQKERGLTSAFRAGASRSGMDRQREQVNAVLAELPAVISTMVRSPVISNTVILRKRLIKSTPALVRVSDRKTMP